MRVLQIMVVLRGMETEDGIPTVNGVVAVVLCPMASFSLKRLSWNHFEI